MDFYQDTITTIHALSPRFDETVLARTRQATRDNPAGLVIPMLYSEIERPAMELIAKEIAGASFLNEVWIALGASSEREERHVVEWLRDRGVRARVLWIENPEVQDIWRSLRERGLDVDLTAGKGFAVWNALGVASLENHAILVHDADVETYSQRFLTRLLLPVVAKDMDFFFSKGMYARITEERLYGRVVRLFMWPLLDALAHEKTHRSAFLRYLRAFRYPLSGEFAITSDLALNVRVPTDWGLEVGLLGEVFRNASLKRIVQVDLGAYSHKHQPLGSSGSEGLLKMASDITTTILRTLTENEGVAFGDSDLLALRVLYRRLAQDSVRKYYVDATANGLAYDRHAEEMAIEGFARVIEEAGRGYLANPGREQLPDWLRVLSADGSVRERLAACAKGTM